ncbi:MAG: hypothetical protein A3J83_02045 [Elusimicrobia bacterium RIFOXYA2_FULL_40_6]|nr:MAG: hypothetical protein A3J83_02045 [Elusimicrobia bacterium RIFOXYA2_FULL_40_6]
MDKNIPVKNEDLIFIEETLAGNRESFSCLVDKYKDRLFNLVYRFMGNKDDTMDVCQDAFLQAYTHLNTFKIDCNFSTWLFTIAVNISKNKLKRKKFLNFSIDRQVQTEDDEINNEPADKNSHSEETMLKQERAELLNEMIGSLSSDYKIPFLLKHQENRSLEEIARITNLSVGVVKIRIHRARNILYNSFKERL